MNEIWIQIIGLVGALGLFISFLGWRRKAAETADYAKKNKGWAIACFCFAVLFGTCLGISHCLFWEGLLA